MEERLLVMSGDKDWQSPVLSALVERYNRPIAVNNLHFLKDVFDRDGDTMQSTPIFSSGQASSTLGACTGIIFINVQIAFSFELWRFSKGKRQ